MKRFFLVIIFLIGLSVTSLSQSNPPITVRQVDGSLPKKTNPTELIFPNGSLTINGSRITIATGGGSGAPTDAKYITQTPNSSLSAEQALSALATGLLKNTTSTGVLSIAGATDLPSGIDASKVADGSISNAEFQRLDGLTSGIQGQLDTKLATTGSGASLTFPGSLSIASGKTATISNTLTFTGIDSSTLNVGTGGTLGTGAFAALGATRALDNLASVAINSALLPATDASIALGSGNKEWTNVFLSGQVKFNGIGGDAVGYTNGVGPTFPDSTTGFVLRFNTQSLGTDRIVTWPDAAGTVALTANNLSVFASTTSAQLRGVLSDEAGAGVAWFGPKRDIVDAGAFCSDAGSNDTYACSLSPAVTGYVTGVHYRFVANTANTGAATLNLNSLGAKTIKKAAGGVTTDLADNDIRAGQWVDVVYDGTNMQMQSLLGNAPSGGGITNSAGANIIPKSDGTNLVASRISDAGANVTVGAPLALSSNILDGNGRIMLELSSSANPVNHFGIGNTDSGDNPDISVYGPDADIAITIIPKGQGILNLFAPNSQVLLGDNGNGNGTNETIDDFAQTITFTAANGLVLNKTITVGGTTGAQTINKTTGSVNFAATATSLIVTNSLVLTSSIIQCTVATNDATMKSAQCVAGSGSFTIYSNAAATAETRVNFTVTN